MPMGHKFAWIFLLMAAASAQASITFTPDVPRTGEIVSFETSVIASGGVATPVVTIVGRTIRIDSSISSIFGGVSVWTLRGTFVAPSPGAYTVEFSLAGEGPLFRDVVAMQTLIVTDGTCRFEDSLRASSFFVRAGETTTLRWCELAGASYGVYRASSITGPFTRVAELAPGVTSLETTSSIGEEFFFVESRGATPSRTRIVSTTAWSGNCFESPSAVCLHDRFLVEVRWMKEGAMPADRRGGTGRVLRLSKSAAAFWFFNEDNVEVTVKVIDACNALPPRFWVFASGMTNVATTIAVRDTRTGARRTYESAADTPFATVLDTNALACP